MKQVEREVSTAQRRALQVARWYEQRILVRVVAQGHPNERMIGRTLDLPEKEDLTDQGLHVRGCEVPQSDCIQLVPNHTTWNGHSHDQERVDETCGNNDQKTHNYDEQKRSGGGEVTAPFRRPAWARLSPFTELYLHAWTFLMAEPLQLSDSPKLRLKLRLDAS
jgi:hypothetical protein